MLPRALTTTRLALRPWSPADAVALKGAIDDSLEHLQAWMPWAMTEPTPLEGIHDRLHRFAAAFDAGEEWLYGVFLQADGSLVGGLGVHRRSADPAVLELGYWVRRSQCGRGYAREAVHAVTSAALAIPGIQRLEIRCDPTNARSARVAEASGFVLHAILPNAGVTPTGAARDSMVWTRDRIIVADPAP